MHPELREQQKMDETAGMMLLLATWILTALVKPPSAAALWLSLPAPNGTKCIWEDLDAGVLTLAEYAVARQNKSDVTPTVSVKVTSPSENTLHHQENITTGQFGFAASEQGTYKLCFTLDSTENTSIQTGVNIDWKIGFAAKDWEAIAKKENIELLCGFPKGVELGLRKVVVYAKLIHQRMLHLVGKGEKMKNDSEKANYRVALFSLMSVVVCILSSALQLRHLKGYFHKKRLI
ncbi:transmembrane emp24 domain-containing protein p24delta4-like [Zingiber officinale]|uniref:transmembrane emp24 domain-containing protein p24delta4-like n=1 Tax=Zingiber officinale TaxID=94328 RepID=UPI001C4CD9E7|nr:transmembrane emp24 domain-containing protein p24delta4-like [Zingiber officinale]